MLREHALERAFDRRRPGVECVAGRLPTDAVDEHYSEVVLCRVPRRRTPRCGRRRPREPSPPTLSSASALAHDSPALLGLRHAPACLSLHPIPKSSVTTWSRSLVVAMRRLIGSQRTSGSPSRIFVRGHLIPWSSPHGGRRAVPREEDYTRHQLRDQRGRASVQCGPTHWRLRLLAFRGPSRPRAWPGHAHDERSPARSVGRACALRHQLLGNGFAVNSPTVKDAAVPLTALLELEVDVQSLVRSCDDLPESRRVRRRSTALRTGSCPKVMTPHRAWHTTIIKTRNNYGGFPVAPRCHNFPSSQDLLVSRCSEDCTRHAAYFAQTAPDCRGCAK